MRRKGQKRGGHHIYIFSHYFFHPLHLHVLQENSLFFLKFLHLMHIYFLLTTNTPATSLHFPHPTTKFCTQFQTMSMSTASYLLLFFLCISLHACYARHLSPLNMKLQEKPHFSIKVCQLITSIIIFYYWILTQKNYMVLSEFWYWYWETFSPFLFHL